MKILNFILLFCVSISSIYAQDTDSISFSNIREILIDHRPHTADTTVRCTAIKNIDQIILGSFPPLHPGTRGFMTSMFRKAILEIEHEVLTEGASVWQFYNHGFVVKTSSVCFGIDLYDFFSSGEIAELADFIDVLFISHEHKDHNSPALVSRMNTLGKAVIGPAEATDIGITEFMQAGDQKIISQLLVKAHYGMHNVPVRQYEITTPEGIKILHTGDNQTSETIPEITDVNVLLLNAWVNESGATSHINGARNAIAKIKPDVCLPGHILELGHLGGGYIVPYYDVFEVPKSGLPSEYYVLAWGERYHFPHAGNDSIRPNKINNPGYTVDSDTIRISWDAPSAAEDGDTAAFYRLVRTNNDESFLTENSYRFFFDSSGIYSCKIYSYDHCGNQSDEYVSLNVIVAGTNTHPYKENICLRHYPNPFNGNLYLDFSLPERIYVDLRIYNLSGEEIKILVSGELPAGTYKFEWNAEYLSGGIYYYRFKAGNHIQSGKILLAR